MTFFKPAASLRNSRDLFSVHDMTSMSNQNDNSVDKTQLKFVCVQGGGAGGPGGLCPTIFLEFIEQKCQPFFVQSLFNLVILNVLWTIVAGKRLVKNFLIKKVKKKPKK